MPAAYGLKSEKQFVNALEDHICFCGTMDKLAERLSGDHIMQEIRIDEHGLSDRLTLTA